MKKGNFLFTSESVSNGHPDKICDQLSDRIVDAYLSVDPYAHTAVEVMATTNRLIIAGEVKSSLSPEISIEEMARELIKEIGYEQEGFDWKKLVVENHLHAQSADIDNSLNDGGAGDQGIMFGYACQETEELMPAPIFYAHRILENLNKARLETLKDVLFPDAKSQVTVLYKDGKPIGIHSVVVSSQHHPDYTQDQIREVIRPVVEKSLPSGWMCPEENFYVNPSGRFVIGGPDGDVGLTGRKIIVDTYGGAAPHGGGAFSGKDSSKVDRSAAYMARYIAKNIVKAGLAERCTLQLSYAIGVSKPLSLYVDTHGTGLVPETVITNYLERTIDFSPIGIRNQLQLNRPIYEGTATYGHFGRKPKTNGCFSWERLDLAELFRELLLK